VRRWSAPHFRYILTFVTAFWGCVLGYWVRYARAQAFLRGALSLCAVAAAALLVAPLAAASAAQAQERTAAQTGAETAALPRVNGLDANGLPRVLSTKDVARYRKIFVLQEDGRWDAADAQVARLEDRRLLGHVRYQRLMHPTDYRSSYAELRRWLASYADLPGADRVHRLALRRKPADAAPPRAPEGGTISLGGGGPDLYTYTSPRDRTAAERARVIEIERTVRRNVFADRLTVTEELLARDDVVALLDDVERARALAKVASGWFYMTRDAEALRVAGQALDLAGDKAPVALWAGGLAAWRSGDIETAYARFSALAEAEHVGGWMRAAGGFWASRGALRLRRPGEMSGWLRIAAEFPRTFYGLLGRAALGLDTDLGFERPTIDDDTLARLLERPRALRAAALMQVGRRDLAADELMMLQDWHERPTAHALLALTERARLPGLAFRLASHLDSAPTRATDPAVTAALYPIPPWEPANGWQVDRALLYALMRQESKFDPDAQSPYGASGLMQIMPATASYIAGDDSLEHAGRDRLFDPGFNLDLAQRYLLHLMEHTQTGNDLLRLAAAYNGGPGNLRKWQGQLQDAGVPLDDPLLFIESLPSLETRMFIERVLTNLWIYRARLGQPAPSLEALAGGVRPIYVSLD
jgi:soluble lytic murein transglycosylase-like protein